VEGSCDDDVPTKKNKVDETVEAADEATELWVQNIKLCTTDFSIGSPAEIMEHVKSVHPEASSRWGHRCW